MKTIYILLLTLSIKLPNCHFHVLFSKDDDGNGLIADFHVKLVYSVIKIVVLQHSC